MFSDVGWGEVLVILVAAVVIFGPDKLPKLAADLAKGLRMVKGWTQRARSEIEAELPPEFRNIDIASLHPKTFVRKALLEDDPLDDEPMANGSSVDDAHPRQLAAGQLAPVDVDAT